MAFRSQPHAASSDIPDLVTAGVARRRREQQQRSVARELNRAAIRGYARGSQTHGAPGRSAHENLYQSTSPRVPWLPTPATSDMFSAVPNRKDFEQMLQAAAPSANVQLAMDATLTGHDHAEVAHVLTSLGLRSFLQVFLHAGVDDIETLCKLSDENMRSLGMKCGHMIKLLTWIGKAACQTQPFKDGRAAVPPSDLHGAVPCRYFQRGQCARGGHCWYPHSVSRGHPPRGSMGAGPHDGSRGDSECSRLLQAPCTEALPPTANNACRDACGSDHWTNVTSHGNGGAQHGGVAVDSAACGSADTGSVDNLAHNLLDKLCEKGGQLLNDDVDGDASAEGSPPANAQTTCHTADNAATVIQDVWSVLAESRVLENSPVVFLRDRECGRGYNILYGPYASGAKVVLLRAPYLLQNSMLDRLKQFLDMISTYPSVEAAYIYTDGYGAGADPPQAAKALRAHMLLRGIQVQFVIEPGMHDRVMYFISSAHAWKVTSDRGLDHARRGPLYQEVGTSPCKRTKIEATKVVIDYDVVRSVMDSQGEGNKCFYDQATTLSVERMLGQYTAQQLRKRIRAMHALQVKHGNGGTLDNWQLRKLRKLPIFLAALRLATSQTRDLLSAGPAETSDSANSSDTVDAERALGLAAVVQAGQRSDPLCHREWVKFVATAGSGRLDPRSYQFTFVRQFLSNIAAHPRWRPGQWLREHIDTLSLEGLDFVYAGLDSNISTAATLLSLPQARAGVDVTEFRACSADFVRAKRLQLHRAQSAEPRCIGDEVIEAPPQSPRTEHRGRSMSPDRRNSRAFDMDSLRGRVYIANLGSDVTAEEVRVTCSQYGSVLNCHIGRAPGFAQQYALVQFSTSLDAESAIQSLSLGGWLIRRALQACTTDTSGSVSSRQGRAGRQHRVSSRGKSSSTWLHDDSASPWRESWRPHLRTVSRSAAVHEVPIPADSDEDFM